MTQQQKPRGYFLDRDWIANEISSSQVQYLAQLENIQSKRREELNQLLHKANTQPDLLEACELMVEYCEEQQIYDKLSKHGDFYYKAKAAIDKVKGGSK